ncbi:MAG: glycosyltransferase family 4 protein [Hyphomicrobium sp.]
MTQIPAPTVVFMNRYFAPDHSSTSQMLSDVAFALADRGMKIAVIASRQLYDSPQTSLPAVEKLQGVSVHRVWTTRYGRANLFGRALDYATFYLSAAFWLLRHIRRGDIVVVKTDPPMLSVIVAPIAKQRGARVVNWLQDVFPEVAEVLGLGSGRLSRFAYGGMRALRNRSLRSADMNVVLGERMALRLQAFGVAPGRIRTIMNFADGQNLKPLAHEKNELRRSWGLGGQFVVGYSGNLGRAHEYATFLDAISAIETANSSHAPVVWLFIGAGALYEKFRAAVQERGLSSVRFEPYQPRERLSESLSAADVHLVSLRPDLEGLIVPSKFYGVAAAGRPVVFVGDLDGEIARQLARLDCGVTVREGDGKGLAQALLVLAGSPERLAIMGRNARRGFEAEFDKPIAIARWQALLEALIGSADEI